MVYTNTIEKQVEEGDLLLVSQVKIALQLEGKKVDKQTILKWIRQGRLKATRLERGERKERFEWLIDPEDLKKTISKMHKKRPPGGSWFKD